MKHLVKAVLPEPVIDRVRETKGWLGLATAGRVKLECGSLCVADNVRLEDIFASREIGAAWEEDHRTIKALYGDEDTMGGVNPGDRRALYYLVMGLKAERVLEVGTHIGASTLHIAGALKRLGRDARMTSVDILDVNDAGGPWKKLGLAKTPKEFARELECEERIEFCARPSLEFMRKDKRRYDLVFLDGDHGARAVYQEVGAALALLKPGGVILLHDYYPGAKALYPEGATISGPFHAMERVRRENPEVAVVPLGELPWPTKLGKNVTTLALLVRAGEVRAEAAERMTNVAAASAR
jgi:predicted O-methyltransferase YrrM